MYCNRNFDIAHSADIFVTGNGHSGADDDLPRHRSVIGQIRDDRYILGLYPIEHILAEGAKRDLDLLCIDSGTVAARHALAGDVRRCKRFCVRAAYLDSDLSLGNARKILHALRQFNGKRMLITTVK